MVEASSPVIKITSVDQLVEVGVLKADFTKDELAQHSADCFGPDIVNYIRAHFPTNREKVTYEEAYQMIRSYHIVGSGPISVQRRRFNSHAPKYEPGHKRF